MKRRVIQIADSTQLVSLPRKWAIQRGIKKGDELEVKEEGNRVIVSTEKGNDLGSIEVDITDLDRDSLMFLIRCLYYKGYDMIKVKFNKATTMHHKMNKEVTVISSIQKEVNRLTGMEIIQQKENFCVIKDISEGTIKEFDNVLRRIFLLLTDASKDLVNAVKNEKPLLLDTINEKYNTIIKFISYNLRLLNKFGYTDSNKTNQYYTIMASLDDIITIIKGSAKYIQSKKLKVSKEAASILSLIHSTLELYANLFYDFDYKKLGKISRNRTEIVERTDKAMKKISRKEILVLTSMEQCVEVVIRITVTRMALEY